MKKIIILLLAFLTIVNLQACGNTAASINNAKNSTSSVIVNDKNTDSADESGNQSCDLPQSVGSKSAENDSSIEPDSNKQNESGINEHDDSVIMLLEQKASEITKNTKTELADGYQIVGTANGDLNSDGHSDLAVVVEKVPGEWVGSRTIYVLIQNKNGSYTVKHANSLLLLGNKEGGPWGDPLEKVEIRNEMLSVYEYGGSNDRWRYIDRFKYIDGEFDLIAYTELSYSLLSGYGIQQDYDFINKTVKYMSCSDFVNKDDCKSKLIYLSAFEDEKINFEALNYKNLPDIEYNFLPSLVLESKPKSVMNLKISADRALDLVKDKIKPQMKKVPISWTEETKANYSGLVFYQVPDYYYKVGNSLLYYDSNREEQDGKIKHEIILSGENYSMEFYTVDDSTGTVEKKDDI